MKGYPFESVVVENIVENLSAGLLIIDPAGRISYANRAVGAILGYPSQLVEGKSWAEVFFGPGDHSDSNDDFNQVLIDAVVEKKVGLKHTVRYTSPSGERMFLSLTTSFLRDDGQTAGVVVLIDDLTELYRLHERERCALREKNRIEKERSEGLKQFAMAVAHQVRNPVMTIGGFARRLKKCFQPETAESKYADYILSAAQRLDLLVRTVTEYTSYQEPVPSRHPLSVIVEDLRLRLEERARRSSKSIEWDIRCGPEQIDVDERLFCLALYGVGLNALEFSPDEKARITIATKTENDRLCIEISDRGAGIEDKHIPFVFDPFFSTKALGTGLGLCKARAIVAGHGGEIQLRSGVGGGTSVLIKLPREVRRGDESV